MAVRQRIVVLNQRRPRPLSQLVYVHYFIRENVSPLATMSEGTILQIFCLAWEQIQQLLHLVGPTLLRKNLTALPPKPRNSAAVGSPFLCCGEFPGGGWGWIWAE